MLWTLVDRLNNSRVRKDNMEEDNIKIAEIYLTMHKIVGNNVTKYCNALRMFLKEYQEDKGLSGNEILDIEDFMRWLEAKHYDWMSRV